MKRTLLTFWILAFAVSAAYAGITPVAVGPVAPPAALGGVAISPFNGSGLPVFSALGGTPLLHPATGVTAVLGGAPLDVRKIGSGWATWSHIYGGEVYYTGGATSMGGTLTGGGLDAFLIYAEPNPFQIFTMTVTTNDGGILSQAVDGSAGAAGFGFFGTGGTKITGFQVSSSVDFAAGELYGGNTGGGPGVPEPTSLLLLGLGMAGIAAWRRKN